MRKRNIKKNVWLSREEAEQLRMKAIKVGVSEADVLRNLIMDYSPQEKPPTEFYDSIKELRAIGNNLNQIAKVAHSLKYIDDEYYKKQVEILQNFILKVKEEFLLPKKNS